MERPMTGDVVVVSFPFSDYSSTKRRPALVAADLPGDDFILCQITSVKRNDIYSISLHDSDFSSGSLSRNSVVRVNRLLTAHKSLALSHVGSLKRDKMKLICQSVAALFN